MQSYNNSAQLLSEFLDFLKYKIDNGLLTLGEVEGLRAMFFSNLPLSGTAEEIAGYYHRSEQDVRNVIHRKLLAKPVRRVHYSFDDFQRIVPESWREKKK